MVKNRNGILIYCENDVRVTVSLLPKLLPDIFRNDPRGEFGQRSSGAGTWQRRFAWSGPPCSSRISKPAACSMLRSALRLMPHHHAPYDWRESNGVSIPVAVLPGRAPAWTLRSAADRPGKKMHA